MNMRQVLLRSALPSRIARLNVATVRHTKQNCRLSSSSSAEPVTAETNEINESRKNNDAFRLFHLPYSFQIDQDALRSTYHEFMRNLHPDKQQQQQQQLHTQSNNGDASNWDDDETLGDAAAIITNAYDTLKRPHVRATHLLDLLGHSMTKEGSEEQMPVGMAFLTEIMQIRQAVDSVDTDAQLKPLLDQNALRIKETCKQLAAAFEASDMPLAMQLTAHLQYWNRIDETLRDKMGSLE